MCDTNINTTSASGSFTVDAVTSLTPSAGVLAPNTTNVYLVQYGCNSNITVTAGDCAGLSPSNLPSCWTTSVTGSATQIDKMHFSIDGNTVVKSTVTITCGSSSQTITIIVYQAKFEIDVYSGDCLLDSHAWWNLSIQPSDMQAFIPRDLLGLQGIAGYYGDDTAACGWPRGCPGHIEFGPQQNHDSGGYYSAICSYWWCISFDCYKDALNYVGYIWANPGNY